MTKAQERARARRRYEKVQAKQARKAADAARFRRVLAVLGVVAVVAAGLAVLGLKLSKVDPAPAVNAAGCQAPPRSLGTGAQLTLPDKASAEGKTFTAVLTTNCGDLVLTLDGANAPTTVASFAQLARNGYWTDAPCSRLVMSGIFILQCGDPTGTQQGDPGYGFGLENAPADGKFPRGSVAMARRNGDPNSNGGQFFLVVQDTVLPTTDGGYSLFGTVTSGMDIVDRIAAGGNGTDGVTPKLPISFLSVTTQTKD